MQCGGPADVSILDTEQVLELTDSAPKYFCVNQKLISLN